MVAAVAFEEHRMGQKTAADIFARFAIKIFGERVNLRPFSKCGKYAVQ